MPQPLSNFRNPGYISISGEGPSKHRPALALLAMTVIADYSILEDRVRSTFVALLGANAAISAAIFTSIRNQAGQRDALRVAASTALEGNDFARDVAAAVFSICFKADGLRNKVAHWVWGYCGNLPNAVLLIDPLATTANTAALHDALTARRSGDLSAVPPDYDLSKVMVYEERDFNAGIETIAHARKLASMLHRILSRHSLNPLKEGDPELLQLSNEPEIRRILDRHRSGQNIAQ